ncbi:MAG: hypothetical protein HUJ30_06820 [Gammaproteobacteria bacterium]|nr:hypothetical protein [Gammaproteobacteria bacterium]
MKVVSFIFVFFLVSCSSPVIDEQAVLEYKKFHQASFELVYTTHQNDLIDTSFGPQDIFFAMPYISGQIFGSPDVHGFCCVSPESASQVSLQLKRMEHQMRKVAKSLNDNSMTHGLSIAPAETRIARVGVLAFDERSQNIAGDAGFVDPNTREYLILIYSDRACLIKGEIMLGTERFVHNIELNRSGLHWLRVEEYGDNNYYLENTQPMRHVFMSVNLPDLTRL